MKVILIFLFFITTACQRKSDNLEIGTAKDTGAAAKNFTDTTDNNEILTGTTRPVELTEFAKTLIGVPYKYGSTNPAEGFDCSGFITFVFNHFNIPVPRSSIDFTNVKREINIKDAKPGDLILFTGTDSSIRKVGHMGIITSAENQDIQFIHSTSGRANGVTITPLNSYYRGRFVKVLRVFKENDSK